MVMSAPGCDPPGEVSPAGQGGEDQAVAVGNAVQADKIPNRGEAFLPGVILPRFQPGKDLSLRAYNAVALSVYGDDSAGDAPGAVIHHLGGKTIVDHFPDGYSLWAG